MKFQIPEIFKPGFIALSALSKKDFDALLETIRSLPVGVGVREFQEALRKTSLEDTNEISKTIFSLGNLLNSTSIEISVEELSKDLADSFEEESDDQVTVDEKQDLIGKLVKILSSENLNHTFKALNLISENDQIFREARIISDVRVIFNDDLKASTRSGVIIHRLKIEYQKNQSVKDFYLSLDSGDLQKLRKQIDRAIEKEKILKSDYSNIKFIEISDTV